MRRLCSILALAGAVGAAGVVRAADAPVYVIAVGYNGTPPAADSTIAPLRFADDDAAAFYSFTKGMAARTFLLALLDEDTQTRFPGFTAEARPPTREALQRTFDEIRAAVVEDVSKGREPELVFFYSGHGTRGPDGGSALTLLDDAVSRDLLVATVAKLPARFVHLVIDACYAEALVRPRDVSATRVDVKPADLAALESQSILERFPQVGVLLSATRDAQSHEWDALQAGVFTHELVSGLRGGADVNGDGLVEYSEIAAFIAAANRAVADPRARLRPVASPPRTDPRAALVNLGRLRDVARLRGRPAALGRFYVEDERGVRLADIRAEAGHHMSLVVPAERTLFLRTRAGEASFVLPAGSVHDFEKLALQELPMRPRGAMEASLSNGLFATTFGPSYYRGFIDRGEGLTPIPFGAEDELRDHAPAAASASPWRRPRQVAFGAAGALGVSTLVLGGLALQARNEYQQTEVERTAAGAERRMRLYGFAALGTGLAAVASGWLGTYFWGRESRDALAVTVRPDGVSISMVWR